MIVDKIIRLTLPAAVAIEEPFHDSAIAIPDVTLPEPFQPSLLLDVPPPPKQRERRSLSPVHISDASCSYDMYLTLSQN